MTPARWRRFTCEMRLRGGPADGARVVLLFSSDAHYSFRDPDTGKVHHYRGIPGRPGTFLEYVCSEPLEAE
jgi:hypothetical protein